MEVWIYYSSNKYYLHTEFKLFWTRGASILPTAMQRWALYMGKISTFRWHRSYITMEEAIIYCHTPHPWQVDWKSEE